MELAAPQQIRRDARPPITMDAAPPWGAASTPRPTVRQRPLVAPALWVDPDTDLGYDPDHPYVRRYWSAVLGAAAVADLLRLTAAARRGGAIRRPLHLNVLAEAGLIRQEQSTILIRPTVPPLGGPQVRRLPHWLRREHRSLRWEHPHRPVG